jgi:hypothetical protein
MFFKQLENGKPVGGLIPLENLKHILDLDFDGEISIEEYAAQGFAIVNFTDMPYAKHDEKVFESEPILNPDGTYTQVWTVEKIPDELIDQKFQELQKQNADHKQHLLDVYAEQLKNPEENEDGIAEINRWIAATEAVDLSDPFNVIWPTEESVNQS